MYTNLNYAGEPWKIIIPQVLGFTQKNWDFLNRTLLMVVLFHL